MRVTRRVAARSRARSVRALPRPTRWVRGAGRLERGVVVEGVSVAVPVEPCTGIRRPSSPSQAPALSPGSCLSIAPCNVVSSGPGATPSSSASRVRRDSYDARASLWRPVAYRALMRNACRRSRSGWSATRPASSAARSAWSPVSRRARAWSSRAVRRCSARRSAAGRTKGASAKSAYAGPRHSSRASVSSSARTRGSATGRARATRARKRTASVSSSVSPNRSR